MLRFCDVSFAGKAYRVQRAKLKTWLALEDIKQKFGSSWRDENFSLLLQQIASYFHLSIPELDKIEWETLTWLEIAQAFFQIEFTNLPNLEYPILKVSNAKRKAFDWDYHGRSWYTWLHILASRYHWAIEYIAELEVDDAIALLQEILSDQQNEREWEWQLSEVAYRYDKSTKKSHLVPLPRPNWMAPVTPEIQKIKMKRSYLPVGNVISRVEDL